MGDCHLNRPHQSFTMGLVYLGLGTNLSQRRVNLQQAMAGLRQVMQITAVSPLYETDPWGVADQPRFLNLCLAGTTIFTPHELLTFCKNLEIELGRSTTYHWGPRLIDIDILFYDDLVLQNGRLTLPHPRMAERAFVLAPLADIAPDFIHPQHGKTIQELLTAVDLSTVRKMAEPLEVCPEPGRRIGG